MGLEDIAHKQLGGLFVQVLDQAPVVLMAQAAGFDFLFFDGEHGDIDRSRLSSVMLLGNSLGIPSIVRAPQLARADVSRMLDLGASGVMVPMVETAAQARQLVQWAKYPPVGARSYSGGAHTGYGPSGHHAQNMSRANVSTLAIAQIETVEGVRNVRDILAVPGLDAAIVGPCDLADGPPRRCGLPRGARAHRRGPGRLRRRWQGLWHHWRERASRQVCGEH